ncbi:phage integrase [Rhizobium grahamii CCGE 502]|uniref:Phage integrase n=2 Tax=Rhizobium grahamii TaxID=1120045 RepID=S3HIU5_9HYPH|nr:phage integrase [Rhizobium grahamii CCGE 502]
MQIKKAKASEKPKKLADSGGLYILLAPSGSKLWRLKYRYNGSEKLLSIGPYPEISLLEARSQRDSAKALLRAGKDPGTVKKLQKLSAVQNVENTFEAVAREWFKLNKETWVPRHANDVIGSLEKMVFPHIGNVPVREINVPSLVGVLRLVEARPAIETARRLRQRISAVFQFAISSGLAEFDPATQVIGALAPLKKGRQPAITSLEEAREMLRRVEQEKAHPVTKLAHRLLAMTFVRPGAVQTTPWSELNGIYDDLWVIPAARMKMRLRHKDDEARDHLVPLPRQATEVIAALRALTGRGPWVFPNTRHSHKPMSENAIGYLLNRAGYHGRHVPHGWRSTFSSVMNERFPADNRVIDLMLSHVPKDKVEGAYNRAQHIERRKALAQIWADLILEDAIPTEEILAGPRR